MKSFRDGQQPSGAASIFKGVPTPAETLPIGLEARQRISALYEAHALALVRLAVLMTGDQATAEDVVQDAFLGLYRRWRSLQDADKALGYLRTSVLNGCRSLHRTRFRRQGSDAGCAGGGLRFTAYSLRTSQPVRVLYQYPGACHNGVSYLSWTSASATEIIGATGVNLAGEGGKQAAQLGVITAGHFQPLKIARSVSPASYGTIAF